MGLTRLLSLIAFCSVLLASCKSGDKNATPSGPIDGFFRTQLIHYPPYPNDSAEIALAVFFPNGDTTRMPVNVGPVLLNSDSMIFDVNFNYYEAPGIFQDAIHLSDSVVWRAPGNATAASFSYSDPGPYPSYRLSLPDTIFKATGATLNFVLNGADSGIVKLPDNPSFSKTISGANSSITFSPADLANSASGYPTYFIISLYSRKDLNFGGKNYYFLKEMTGFRFIFVY